MRKKYWLAATLALLPFMPAFAAETAAAPASKAVAVAKKTSTPTGWLDDMEAAKKQARAEGKMILVDFSGSDWCGWCIRLDKEVFSKKEFLDVAKEEYVLVFIDSPRERSLLSENAKKQNPALAEHYGIRGYPTVRLLDADGIVVAQTGYESGGPKKYLKHLDEIKTEGLEKSKLTRTLRDLPTDAEGIKKIDAILAELPSKRQYELKEFVEKVLAADPDGKLGLRAHYPFFTVVLPLVEEMKTLQQEIGKRIEAEVKASKLTEEELRKPEAVLPIIKKAFLPEQAKFVALLARAEASKAKFPPESESGKTLSDLAKGIQNAITQFGDASEAKADEAAK